MDDSERSLLFILFGFGLDKAKIKKTLQFTKAGCKGLVRPSPDSLGSNPGREHCVVFLDKALCSHSASLHPGA